MTSQVLLTEVNTFFLKFNLLFYFQFYQTIFEEPFLSATIKYYKFLTNQTFADSECSVYMEKVVMILSAFLNFLF